MIPDFTTEYSSRSDDELLHLASARHSLVPDAAAALDSELHRRNLTESDRLEYKKSVKRQECREVRSGTAARRRWRNLGLKDKMSGRDVLEAFAAMAIIAITYLALPSLYRLKPDWQEAAFIVMITSVVLVFLVRSWRNIVFWISLSVSSVIHLFVVHAWTHEMSDLSRNEGRGATFIGLLLFLVVYGTARLLRRALTGDQEGPPMHSENGRVIG